MFGKSPGLEIWPKKDRFFEKKYLFSMAHISVTSEANWNLFWFSESSRVPLSPMVQRFFTISAPLCRKSRLNISPNFGEKSGFSNISSLDRPIKLKLCSQLEDRKGCLKWRYHVDYISSSWLMVLGPKIWVPILVFRFSRVWVVGFASYCTVS